MLGFPRIAGYFWNSGHGYPWTVAKTYGAPLDMASIVAAARYPIITADIAPVFDPDPVTGRPDIAAAFRRANPNIKLGIYDMLGNTYLRPDFGDLPDWQRRRKLKVLRETNGVSPDGFIRWEQPATELGLTREYVNVWNAHLGDFFFFDFCWTNTTAGMRAIQRCIHALRQAGCPVVIGNSEVLDKPPSAYDTDGCLQENWPNYPVDPQNIRLWRSGRPHKTHDWLQGGTTFVSHTTADAKRYARFLHGVACTEGMLCSFGPDRDQSVPYHLWWNDFYDWGGRLGVGWLGEPVSAPLRYAANLTRRDFAGGTVVVNAGPTTESCALPKGLHRLDGVEMGSATVDGKDAAFFARLLS